MHLAKPASWCWVLSPRTVIRNVGAALVVNVMSVSGPPLPLTVLCIGGGVEAVMAGGRRWWKKDWCLSRVVGLVISPREKTKAGTTMERQPGSLCVWEAMTCLLVDRI